MIPHVVAIVYRFFLVLLNKIFPQLNPQCKNRLKHVAHSEPSLLGVIEKIIMICFNGFMNYIDLHQSVYKTWEQASVE